MDGGLVVGPEYILLSVGVDQDKGTDPHFL